MLKPNECDKCPGFDKWVGVCIDCDWINKKTGEYCCKWEEDAVKEKEYLED